MPAYFYLAWEVETILRMPVVRSESSYLLLCMPYITHPNAAFPLFFDFYQYLHINCQDLHLLILTAASYLEYLASTTNVWLHRSDPLTQRGLLLVVTLFKGSEADIRKFGHHEGRQPSLHRMERTISQHISTTSQPSSQLVRLSAQIWRIPRETQSNLDISNYIIFLYSEH